MKKQNGERKLVYLVDDDDSVLRLLQSIVSSIGVEVCAFRSARDFLAAYRPEPFECLVCDIRMPDIDGMALQQQLAGLPTTLPIIFLTGFAEVAIAVEAMKRGAFDFIEKPFGAQSLLGKIQAALDHSHQRYVAERDRQAIDARMELLTRRERGVIELVIAGCSSREISERLGISPRTVDNHRARILEKLHVESTVDLVRLFL